MTNDSKQASDPVADWAGLDRSPAASAQMIQWYAPETAAVLSAAAADRPSALYVVFEDDWQTPPGKVVKVFRAREAAEAFRDGPGDGYGYSIIEVQDPGDPRG